jgi:RpiR family transcriptional regulator, repressor of rpiB and als operon
MLGEKCLNPQHSEGVGVSEAMVAKISKKLGFTGFRDFRAGVAQYIRLPTADLHQDLSPDDSSEQIVQKVFRSAIQALEETLAIRDMNAFERAADILYRASERNFYGVGGSAQIARDVSRKSLHIGIQTSVYDDPHMMLMSAAQLGPDDAVIGFSHPGAATAVLDAVAIARKQGARTIAVTSYAGSPLAELSDVVLPSTSRGSPLLGENAAARIFGFFFDNTAFGDKVRTVSLPGSSAMYCDQGPAGTSACSTNRQSTRSKDPSPR